jgi:hypothetical protein
MGKNELTKEPNSGKPVVHVIERWIEKWQTPRTLANTKSSRR